jgi:N-acetylneuraminate lyase
MNPKKLLGLVAAAHTPFKADGTLNLAIVEQQAAHLLHNKLATVFIGGSTGESHSLTLEERRLLAERWSAVTRGTPLGVVIHIGSNCLADARTLAAQAQQLGAQAIAMLSPSYFKPRDLTTLIACCADVAAAAPATPFYFYDIPSLTGTNFSMSDFLAQAPARIPTLVGIKYTNSNLMDYQLCLHAAGGRFDVLYGCDEWMMAACALGAKGAVGSSYNFAAPVYQRLLAALAAGDLATAQAEQFRSVQLIRVLAGLGYMGASKAVMTMLGVDVGPARLPNTTPTADQLKQLRGDLEQLGFFDWIR